MRAGARRGRFGVALISVCVTGAVGLISAGPVSSQTTGRVTVPFATPGSFDFTVPARVCQISVDVRGASGGNASIGPAAAAQARLRSSATSTAADLPAPWSTRVGTQATGGGGLGGQTTATLTVTPGEILHVTVGGAGKDFGSTPPTGGTPDGGNGGSIGLGIGAGGGGSSDLRQGGTDLSHRVVVAGGGGGTGFFVTPVSSGVIPAGAGGGATGQHGDPSSVSNGDSGGGGTQLAGGTRGVAFFGPPIFGTNGNPGALGQGGAGADNFFGGGGGGGGYYGGGGGSAATLILVAALGSAGGGGSGFGPAGATLTSGVNSGNGQVLISYDPTAGACVAAAVVAQPRFTG